RRGAYRSARHGELDRHRSESIGHCCVFFFFTDPAPTEIYPLSLHDALPILNQFLPPWRFWPTANSLTACWRCPKLSTKTLRLAGDRKSTRLNSSHLVISYAVFCLKKKRHRNRRASHTSASTSPHRAHQR